MTSEADSHQISLELRDRIDKLELSSPADPLHQLASEVARHFAEDWARGKKGRAETFLHQHPELNQQPVAALRVIYEEVCLRTEAGESITPSELHERFPGLAAEIEILLAGHDLMASMVPTPQWPAVGETLGEFQLTHEIGRGGAGRVYLAEDRDLAGRKVVIKATARIGGEHLSLARLQHTFIVPLFSVRDYPERRCRLLCMPYLGGTSLDRINECLASTPISQRAGKSLLQSIDTLTKSTDDEKARETPSLRFFRRAGYADAVCWIGACLADALQYAHDQGLVHLDIKPSNILLTKDAQPMLLDFHLARYPIAKNTEVENFGGTRPYMSPEQRQAFESIRATGKSSVDVGPASDIYSLGLTLAECLGWQRPAGDYFEGRIRWRAETGVSTGLSDILNRCLAVNPLKRYRSASELADDLRRHLAQLPLKGVRNRSILERWRKWRRRRPQGRVVITLSLLLALGAGVLAFVYWNQQNQVLEQAKAQWENGRHLAETGDYRGALTSLRQAHAVAVRSPLGNSVRASIAKDAERIQLLSTDQDLLSFVDKMRYLYSDPHLTTSQSDELANLCERAWSKFVEDDPIRTRSSTTTDALIDLALLWADFSARAEASPVQSKERGLSVLRRIESSIGPQKSLSWAKGHYSEQANTSQGLDSSAKEFAWESLVNGRWLFAAGRYEDAAEAFVDVIRHQPDKFWPWFYLGLCRHRLAAYEESVNSLTVAIALRPESAECYFHRANALVALDRGSEARADYDRALSLEPNLGPALLNRGILSLKEQQLDAARQDIELAITAGANLAHAHFHLALIDTGQGNLSTARDHARTAQKLNPDWKEAAELVKRLEQQMP